MSQSFLPQFGMPIVDKNGKATMQLQQFFMRLAKASSGLSVTVQGGSGAVSAISFGNGFDGNLSGTTLSLTAGMDVIDADGAQFQATNRLQFGAGFEVSGGSGGVTISGGGTALRIMQNGVQISDGVDLLNFTGNVQAKLIGDEVYIAVGGVQANGDGGSYSNLASGSNIILTPDDQGDLTISSALGIEYNGTLYSTIAAGSNVSISASGETLTFSASGGGGGNVPSEFRFFGLRVVYSGVSGDSYTSIGQLLVHATPGGSQVCVGGTASSTPEYTASPTEFAAAYPFALASGQLGWATANGTWVGAIFYDLGAGNLSPVEEVVVVARADSPGYQQTPILMTFMASVDGKSWYSQDLVASTWSAGQAQTFEISLS